MQKYAFLRKRMRNALKLLLCSRNQGASMRDDLTLVGEFVIRFRGIDSLNHAKL